VPTDVRVRGGVAARFHHDERGAALLVALMAILLTMALGTALILSAGIESKITRNFRARAEAFYAADAVLEHTVDDLSATGDWNAVLSGLVSSAFTDGPPNGMRVLADGRPLDLGEVVNLANCRQTAPCSNSAMDAATAERPWGANNPRWQLFAWGMLSDLLPGVGSPFYVVTMVADDSSENDGDPLRDGSTPCKQGQVVACNPGTGRIELRAEAFGPFGAHKILEASISRSDPGGREADYNNGINQTGARILSWREMR
jgi:PilX N-terminal